MVKRSIALAAAVPPAFLGLLIFWQMAEVGYCLWLNRREG
jgi:hypothetical protein